MSAIAYTTVNNSSVLGKIILDPSLPADEIHIYRVDETGKEVRAVLHISPETGHSACVK